MKEMKSLANKIAFGNSNNVPHHLTKVVKNRDDKIKELKLEISKLQDIRVENDLLKVKVNQMEAKMFDMQQQIRQFDQAKTIARKVENDK